MAWQFVSRTESSESLGGNTAVSQTYAWGIAEGKEYPRVTLAVSRQIKRTEQQWDGVIWQITARHANDQPWMPSSLPIDLIDEMNGLVREITKSR